MQLQVLKESFTNPNDHPTDMSEPRNPLVELSENSLINYFSVFITFTLGSFYYINDLLFIVKYNHLF